MQAFHLRQELSWAAVAGIVALKALGYAIFRGANSQKDAFRRDPSAPGVRHLRSLQTPSGRRLLVSGWWGIARHINYLGDWLMGCGLGCYYWAAPLVSVLQRSAACHRPASRRLPASS